MGMHVNSALPDPAQIKEELPLAPELKALKAKRDAEIRDVFTGVSNKFLADSSALALPITKTLCANTRAAWASLRARFPTSC